MIKKIVIIIFSVFLINATQDKQNTKAPGKLLDVVTPIYGLQKIILGYLSFWEGENKMVPVDGRPIISPDTKFFITLDKISIKIWDSQSNVCIKTLEHENVRDATMSAHGKYIISGSYQEGTIKIWDKDSGQCIKTIDQCPIFDRISLSHDAKYIFCVSGARITIWDKDSGKRVKTVSWGHLEPTCPITGSAGRYLCSGLLENNALKIWDVNSGKYLKTLSGHTGMIRSIAISSNERYIFSGSEDKTLKIWDLDSGECLKTLSGHVGPVLSLAVSTDGRYFFSGDNVAIKIWDAITFSCIKTLSNNEFYVNSLAVSADGNYIVSASESSDGYIKIWPTQAALIEEFDAKQQNKIEEVD